MPFLLKGVEKVLIYDNFNNISNTKACKPCLIYGETQLTYQEFIEQVNELAGRLAARIKKGDRVIVRLAEPVKQLLYFYGIIKAGGVCILIDAATSYEICANIIEEQKTAFTIDDKCKLPSEQALLPEIKQNDIFLGALSSGSTGTPKVIWRDHQSWTGAFPSQSQVFGIGSEDVLFLAGSLAYTANLNACLHVLSEGGTVVLASSTLPRTWLKEMNRHHVTAIFMVPANYRILIKVIKSPLTELRSIVSGGAKLDRATVQNLVRVFPCSRIVEYYGASELGHVSYSTAGDILAHPESVGKAFPNVMITIEENIIWVESPYLAPKYRPKATVGDLGKIDEAGYLYLLGRKNGMINTGGIKVIPEEVEAVLRQHPGIVDVAVAGIDDQLRGQRVCAWIVRNKANVLAADILDFCHKKMRAHYCPQKIVFVDAIPLNVNGKVDKWRLNSDGVLTSPGF